MLLARLAALASLALTFAAAPVLAAPPLPSDGAPPAAAALVAARFGSAVEVRWDASRLVPKTLRGLSVPTAGRDAAERAQGFVRDARDVFRLDARDDVRALETVAPKGSAHTVVRMQALHDGLVIEGRTVVVTLDDAQRVTSVTSDLGPLVVPAPAATIEPAAARAAVTARFAVASTGAPEKVVVANGTAGRVAWRVPAMAVPLTGHFFVWVDAETGAILRQAPAAMDQAMTRLPERAGAPDEDQP